MIVVSWNIRGLGSGKKRGVIRESLKKIKPDIVILQETKKEALDEWVVGSVWKARFKNWISLPSIGRSGRILLIWDARTVEVVDNLIGSFTVSIKIQKGDNSWWLTRVYGPVSYRERQILWDELVGFKEICGYKWVPGGDFNVVKLTHEKSPLTRSTRSMKMFDKFI